MIQRCDGELCLQREVNAVFQKRLRSALAATDTSDNLSVAALASVASNGDLVVHELEVDPKIHESVVQEVLASMPAFLISSGREDIQRQISISYSSSSISEEEVILTEVNLEEELMVETRPIAPGCTTVECSDQYVRSHISNHLNVTVDPSADGRHRVLVRYTIDRSGNVTNVISRGGTLLQRQEVKRLLLSLPQFTPGYQQGEVVEVNFAIPIVFNIEPAAPLTRKQRRKLRRSKQ